MRGSALACLSVAALLIARTAAVRMALFSDIHLDAFYGSAKGLEPCNVSDAPPFGQFGCDSPPILVDAAVADLTNFTRPDFVMVSGDWMRHRMSILSAEDALTTFKVATAKLAGLDHAVRRTSVLVHPRVDTAFGNNDVVPDYFFNISAPRRDALFRNFTDVLFNESYLSTVERDTFMRCGFYARNVVPGAGSNATLSTIMLNSLMWSTSLAPKLATSPDPCGQFAFLEEELAAARAAGRKVWIMSHIPPTVDPYGVEHHPEWNSTYHRYHYWQLNYERRYLAIVKQYSDVITAQFFGHTHKLAFVGDDQIGVPLFVSGSISPVYANWPNYEIIEVDPVTLRVVSLQQRYFNMSSFTWVSGSHLGALYNVTDRGLDVVQLHDIGEQLYRNASAFAAWRVMNAGGVSTDSCATDYCRALVSCFATNLGAEATARCMAGYGYGA